jgi:hypothetical protein
MVPTLNFVQFAAVLWIRVHIFLGLADPDPSLFYMDPNHAINNQKINKNLDFYYFVISF